MKIVIIVMIIGHYAMAKSGSAGSSSSISTAAVRFEVNLQLTTEKFNIENIVDSLSMLSFSNAESEKNFSEFIHVLVNNNWDPNFEINLNFSPRVVNPDLGHDDYGGLYSIHIKLNGQNSVSTTVLDAVK